MLDTKAAEQAILAMAQTLIDPFSRRGVNPTLEVTKQESGLHLACVRAASLEREAKGPTRELALARLIGKLERELQNRVDAGQNCLVREYATLTEAHRIVVAHDVARKAAG